MFRSKPTEIVTSEYSLPGRDNPLEISGVHAVSGKSFFPPYEDGLSSLRVGMGCFWGAERLFWQMDNVWVTAVGYAGGSTPNPGYQEVCSGHTGHTEIVQVVYHNKNIRIEDIFKVFWENHDPTQGMRQGKDAGTQYRSALYLEDEFQLKAALKSRDAYQQQLGKSGMGQITTEIRIEPTFYFAEQDHQQYLHKNPGGYCNLRGTGVRCVG